MMQQHIKERINTIHNGKVPEGYKESKVGIIPITWNIDSLKNRTIRIGDGIHATPNYTERSDYYFINGNNLVNGKIRITSNTKCIPQSEYLKHGKDLRNGCILMSINGTIGNIAFYNNEKVVLGKSAAYIECNDTKINKDYVFYQLQSKRLQDHFDNELTGTTIKNLSLKSVRETKLLIPPLPEQQKIAEILSTWDEAIRLKQQLIEQKNTQKKGFMQLLLTGKIRVTEMGKLSPEDIKKRVADIHRGIVPDGYHKAKWAITPQAWDFVKIKNIAQQIIEFNTDNTVEKVFSCTKHYGLVDSLEYFKRKIFSDDLSKYKIVRKGHFAYATNHIEEGSIGLQNICEAGLVSPMYTVFKANTSVLSEFLYALLKTETYRRIFEVKTTASIDRRGSLRWNQFSQIQVPVPPFEEQQKIAEILSTADKEIELLEAELEHLKEQKKGLMQLLLTGKIRVNEHQEGETS